MTKPSLAYQLDRLWYVGLDDCFRSKNEDPWLFSNAGHVLVAHQMWALAHSVEEALRSQGHKGHCSWTPEVSHFG